MDRHFIARVRASERGATAVEYGLLIALIFLAAIGAFKAFGDNGIGMWTRVSNEVESVNRNAGQ
ncbi:Flp family type IVb pilin [Sphingomonas changnyeongensis]|uniref:Flp family type IVb pilin n=1 Tax=Sphingomonas changnyeongensis TaxID=2698679 RepID=A0A7Z2NW88_9SPHN|nr:Flp family type IVb pilin [Sphingomonas changnyeongensis]QHL90981.1 Flp family type IVb pilin [Sphingomonas changnyeongensis]